MKRENIIKLIEIRELVSDKWNPYFAGLDEWYSNEDDEGELCEPYKLDGLDGTPSDWKDIGRMVFCASNMGEDGAVKMWDGFDERDRTVTFASLVVNNREKERVVLCAWDFHEDDGSWEMFASVV